jgi:hypothetical protein
MYLDRAKIGNNLYPSESFYTLFHAQIVFPKSNDEVRRDMVFPNKGIAFSSADKM